MTDPRDTAPQPPPVPTESEPIYKQVIRDIEAKAQVGQAKYGTYLQADNGRDHLTDAYQEMIDGTKYLKAAIIERRALLDRIAELEKQLAEALQCAESRRMMGLIGSESRLKLHDLEERLAMAVEALKPQRCGEGDDWYTPPCEQARKVLTATAASVAQHTASVERRGAAEAVRVMDEALDDWNNHPKTHWSSDIGVRTLLRQRFPDVELPEVPDSVAKVEKTKERVERRGAANALAAYRAALGGNDGQ